MDKLSLPFDIYTKYKIISDYIERLKINRLKILDIGGRNTELHTFLPGHKLYILDSREPEENLPLWEGRYLRGNILKPPFIGGSFDICICVDVLEHLKPQDRIPAMKEMIKICRLGTIIGAPFDAPVVTQTEDDINRLFKRLFGVDHPWLKEHIENGPLPDAGQIERFLEGDGYRFIKIGHNNITLWNLLYRLMFIASRYSLDISDISRFYNTNFIHIGDMSYPFYRVIYLISKDPDILKRWDTSDPIPQIDESKRIGLFSQLLELVFSKIVSFGKDLEGTSIEKQQVIDNLKEILSDKDRHLAMLQDNLHHKEKHILILEEQINQNNLCMIDIENRMREKTRQVTELENNLKDIFGSHGWKFLGFYYKLRNAVLPPGTKRRAMAQLLWHILWRYIGYLEMVTIKKRPPKTEHIKTPDKYGPDHEQYKDWIAENEPSPQGLEILRQDAKDLEYRPLISIVMPVYKVNPRWLRLAIESVINQVYDNWELDIAEGYRDPDIIRVLEEYLRKDQRIKVKFLKKNRGIAGNSNEALALARGEFIGLLDHDDELTPFALYEVVKLLNQDRDIDLIYSDEDKISQDQERFEPHFKPDWAPDTLRSYNYIAHFAVIRRSLLEEIRGFRKGYEGAQDYDLFLRVTERTNKIAHIPKVLYHWRAHHGSAAANPKAKRSAKRSTIKALNEHINRIGLKGKAYYQPPFYRIRYRLNAKPKVSIIIPTKDRVELLQRCILSITKRTSYSNYEILIIDNQSNQAETLEYYAKIRRSPRVKILWYDAPFNFSAINNYAISQTEGRFIVFLNNDIEIISAEWLTAMLELAQQPRIGAVGAKLYYPNYTIQHGGVILRIGGIAGHSHKYYPGDSDGYMGRLKVIQNLSAVTAACMMVRKDVFEEVNGFDERFTHAFNDVDLCMKIRQKGYLIVFTPYAQLYHHESLSRGYEDTVEKQLRFSKEVKLFMQKWSGILERGDPYYNPNLTLEKEDFSIRVNSSPRIMVGT